MFDGIDLNGPPNFNDTAIGDALESLQSRLPGERLAGVIILSDGATHGWYRSITAARQLAATGVPIYSFGFGQSVAGEQIKDIAALSINTNPVVFAKNKAPIRPSSVPQVSQRDWSTPNCCSMALKKRRRRLN